MIVDRELDTTGEVASAGAAVAAADGGITRIFTEPVHVTVQVTPVGGIADIRFGMTKVWPSLTEHILVKVNESDKGLLMPLISSIISRGKYFYLVDYVKRMLRRGKTTITFLDISTYASSI